MRNPRVTRWSGFVLIEALIALLLISVGLLAVSKLQVLSLSGAGEARSYSRAMAISQRKMEELRNILLLTQFTGATAPLVAGSQVVYDSATDNASYTLAWAVDPDPTLAPPVAVEQRVLRIRTTWTDRYGQPKALDLNSVLAWDDPGARVKSSGATGLPTLISPTGDAVRGSGVVSSNFAQATPNADGSRIFVKPDYTTELLSNSGAILLELPPKNGLPQSFTTISGKLYFDQGAGNQIPASNFVRLRLSSEGECIFDNLVASLTAVNAGSNSYKYFAYTCYVGPGWYGNVGVVVDNSVTGSAPTVCIGDPGFNGGVSNNTLISSHSDVSATRSYRGFRGTSGNYFSTGVAGGTHYGALPLPVAGAPVPSSYPLSYPLVVAGSTSDFFEQNFLMTRITGNATCAQKMAGGAFARNAGKYVCITPDNETAHADQCPAIWPNFESQVGSGTGVILTVIPAGTGTGMVSSAPAGISCGASCVASFSSGSSVTLTAAPDAGSSFTGWSGASCSGTGTCVVTMSAVTSVTATFAALPSYPLTVTLSGSGSGSVTSAPAGISCGSTCTASYVSGTPVTLSAAPAFGSTFAGWSGACSGTGTCTVAMNAAASVTAGFEPASLFSLSVVRAGSGTVSGGSGAIACGSTCYASWTAATVPPPFPLTAVAAAGWTFTGWSGAGCSGTGNCTPNTLVGARVTATFAQTFYTVSVTKSGTGTGTVSSSPAGISCGATCSVSFAALSSVTLTASPTAGTSFAGWTGACTGTGTCTIGSLSGASAVGATFTLNAACTTPISGSAGDKNGSVRVTPSTAGTCTMQGGNSVGFNCSLSAPSGTSVTLTNERTTGNPQYSNPITVIANCTAQTVNFPIIP